MRIDRILHQASQRIAWAVIVGLFLLPAGLRAQAPSPEPAQPSDAVSGLRRCLGKLNDVADWLAIARSRDCPTPPIPSPPLANSPEDGERERLQARIEKLETQLTQRDEQIGQLQHATRDLAQHQAQLATLSEDVRVMLSALTTPYAQGRCDRLTVQSSASGTVEITGQLAKAPELQERLRELEQQLDAVRLDTQLVPQTLCGAPFGDAWLLVHDAEGAVQITHRDTLSDEIRSKLVESGQCAAIGEALEDSGVFPVPDQGVASRLVFWVKDEEGEDYPPVACEQVRRGYWRERQDNLTGLKAASVVQGAGLEGMGDR